MEKIRANYGKIEPSEEILRRSLKLYFALKRIIKKEQYDFIGVKCQPEMIDNIARYYEPDNITTTNLVAEDDYIGTGLVWNMETNATFFGLNGNVLTADPGNSDIGSYWLKITVNDNVGRVVRKFG